MYLSTAERTDLRYRSELASGFTEHWQGRRGVRAADRSQWPDQVHSDEGEYMKYSEVRTGPQARYKLLKNAYTSPKCKRRNLLHLYSSASHIVDYSNSKDFRIYSFYHAVYPPSMIRCDPVMKEEASLSKKSAAPRYSRGSDIRPNMFSLSQSARSSGSSSKFFLTICNPNVRDGLLR